jgi:hypothetical protein
MKFKYFWIAEYQDGTIIKQFQGKKEIQWSDVDQSQVKQLSWAQKTLLGLKTVIKTTINLKLTDMPMICRRTHIGIGMTNMKEKRRKIEYLLGKNGEYTIKLE